MASVSWQIALLAAALAISVGTTPARKRSKRQAYELPAGSELLLYAPLSTNFRCPGEGYYADVQNNCQVYHVCHQVTRPDGSADTQHYSFMCGNQTVFDQLSLTCAFPEEAVPCASAQDFFYVNNYIGVENAPFLTDDDVRRADAYKQG
ncbi:uncharacterized protein [Dermacentor andersoni]|uniref:uncharacterized protein n=1 Tax=Dermacentor andersoni TaxID=34620 RepID=UPI003B3B7981